MIIPTRRWLAGGALLSVVALAGLVWPAALPVLVAIDLAWLAAGLFDWARARDGDIAVARDAPAAFSVGRALTVPYDWWFGGSRPQVVRVREALPEPLDAPKGERELRLITGSNLELLDVVPARRGVGDGGRITLRRLGPLGLAWRQVTLDRPWAATVYPRLADAGLRPLPARVARRREAGLRSMRRPGEGRLFESLREWVPGEDTRAIDWKATARRGKPIARVYEDERRQQVMLMIDAGRLLTAESDGVARLESAITAALRLAHAAVEHDDDVGLMVFADTVQAFVPPARGRRALRATLAALAAAEGRLVESDYALAFRFLATRSRKRALTVLFTDVIDRQASATLVAQTATLRPRHLPVAVTLRDPSLERVAVGRPATELAAFERAAAEELLQARDAALAAMRRHGVIVIDAPPAAAGDAAVQGYHRLKQRGLL
jgi:uncharacterized protein (DUF58 family)